MRRIFNWIVRLTVGFVIASAGLTAIYRVVDPPMTPLMLIRPIEGAFSGTGTPGIDKQWVPIENIDEDILRSVIAAEDARFLSHGGIDWDAVREAQEYNERNAGKKPMRGASTISMQTARNVFLWQGRNWVRKGLEAYFTYLIEVIWGKRRVLEVYLNVIEWGDGIYGIDAAAAHYFGTTAAELTPRQAGLLAAILPNPRRWNAAKPTGYIQSRASKIQAGARVVSLSPLMPRTSQAE